MTYSCTGLSKICFLLSVTFCACLLLLIPKFQTIWRPRGYPQPRPPPPFNSSCKSGFHQQQAEPSLTDHLDSEETDTTHSVKDETVEKNGGDYSLHTGGSILKLKEQDGSPTSPLQTMLKNHHGPEGDSIKENLELQDIFIAVKTTRKYHKTRLDLLFQTWISQAKRQSFVDSSRAIDSLGQYPAKQTFIFTDWEDHELRLKAGDHMINTNCSAVHTRQALCCKMSVEYDKFLESGRKWFCHVDDDNYLNPQTLLHLLSAFSHSQDVYVGKPSLDHPIEAADHVRSDGSTTVKFWFATGGAGFCISRGLALKMSPWASLGNFISTAERVRLPDDCTIGYIIEGLLEVKLLHSPLFHSHLENLQRLRGKSVLQQVTLSYGGPENKHNVVSVAGVFGLQQDPTRFRSVHCLLYPDTTWCPTKNIL